MNPIDKEPPKCECIVAKQGAAGFVVYVPCERIATCFVDGQARCSECAKQVRFK